MVIEIPGAAPPASHEGATSQRATDSTTTTTTKTTPARPPARPPAWSCPRLQRAYSPPRTVLAWLSSPPSRHHGSRTRASLLLLGGCFTQSAPVPTRWLRGQNLTTARVPSRPCCPDPAFGLARVSAVQSARRLPPIRPPSRRFPREATTLHWPNRHSCNSNGGVDSQESIEYCAF